MVIDSGVIMDHRYRLVSTGALDRTGIIEDMQRSCYTMTGMRGIIFVLYILIDSAY